MVDRLLPDGPVAIGMDDTLERRRTKIKARGIYRDPVRSSKGALCQNQPPALAVADGGCADPLVGAKTGPYHF